MKNTKTIFLNELILKLHNDTSLHREKKKNCTVEIMYALAIKLHMQLTQELMKQIFKATPQLEINIGIADIFNKSISNMLIKSDAVVKAL